MAKTDLSSILLMFCLLNSVKLHLNLSTCVLYRGYDLLSLVGEFVLWSSNSSRVSVVSILIYILQLFQQTMLLKITIIIVTQAVVEKEVLGRVLHAFVGICKN